jgi:hypothetical protein
VAERVTHPTHPLAAELQQRKDHRCTLSAHPLEGCIDVLDPELKHNGRAPERGRRIAVRASANPTCPSWPPTLPRKMREVRSSRRIPERTPPLAIRAVRNWRNSVPNLRTSGISSAAGGCPEGPIRASRGPRAQLQLGAENPEKQSQAPVNVLHVP